MMTMFTRFIMSVMTGIACVSVAIVLLTIFIIVTTIAKDSLLNKINRSFKSKMK